MKRVFSYWHLLAAICCLLSIPSQAQLNFNVNFASGGGPQLVKDKFAVYQTPLAASTRLNANMSKLSEANIKHLRYEIGWAKNESLNAPQITGTADNPQYAWSEFDAFINGLNSNGVTPMYAMTYNPKPLQNNPGDYNQWMSVPNNMGAWQRICRDYANHFKGMGQKPIYEIWNEPDLNGIFFTGNVNDYVNIYKNAVTGIRAAEPTAWVGGPAISGPNLGWFKEFLNGIGNTPITFLSGHIYNANYGQLINTMRQALNETGRAGLPLYITEYSSFNNLNSGEINSSGIASKTQGASRFFRDVRNLLNYSDVQKVYFAQWIDPEVRSCPTCPWNGGWDNMGMIDLSNQRKALYNAFKLYGWMPVDRKAVSPEVQAGVGAMASADANNASVVLWNEGGAQQSINTTFNNLPFSSGTMEVYRIDAGNASKYDGAGENLTVLSTTSITSNSASLNTTIAGNGVVFVKMYRSNSPTGIVSGQVYRLVARHSGHVLDVNECSTADKANVQQWRWLGGNCQRWKVEATDNGYYRLLSQQSGKALDVSDCAANNGANIHQWPYWGGACQQWKIEPTDNGYYKLTARNTTNSVMEVSGTTSTNEGANVQLWEYVGGPNQQWKLEPVAASARQDGETAGASHQSTSLESTAAELYPNPADHQVQIDLSGLNGEKADLTVVNLQGIEVYRKQVQGKGEFKLNTSNLKPGIYTIVLQSTREQIKKKLIIRH